MLFRSGIDPPGGLGHNAKQHEVLAQLRLMQLPDDDAVASAVGELREEVRRQRVGDDQRWTFAPDKERVSSDPCLEGTERDAGFPDPLSVEGD